MDVLRGGPEKDSLLGGKGGDENRGEAGRDTVDGDLGRDIVLGGSNKDVLYGGFDDVMDRLNGGPGFDICFVRPEDLVKSCEEISTSTPDV